MSHEKTGNIMLPFEYSEIRLHAEDECKKRGKQAEFGSCDHTNRPVRLPLKAWSPIQGPFSLRRPLDGAPQLVHHAAISA
ncbi:hypothetical protein HYPP_00370 [Hyphomicrobium sp. ghe19]|nr:hypothetical protein HYPP_00370 [Hyphomicrobium sp. ghe19]